MRPSSSASRSFELAVSAQDIADAAQRLRGVTHRTPVLTSQQANRQTSAQVFFKAENFQRTGSFKLRGAYNAISQLDETRKRRGVAAFSSGNHAQGVALAARLLGVSATIVMPKDAPASKLAATRGYGANVVLYDPRMEKRETVTETLIQEHGLSLIPPYGHPHIIAGQGTAAAELIEEVGPLDYLFAPVGGAGLLSGSAIAASEWSPDCRVIGVEPEAGDDGRQSFRSGRVVTIPVPDTIADGARTQYIGEISLPILQAHVFDMVTVSDAQLQTQMRFFAERMKIVVEPTGCLGAAAVFNAPLDLAGARVGVILSGGNVDADVLCRALQVPGGA